MPAIDPITKRLTLGAVLAALLLSLPPSCPPLRAGGTPAAIEIDLLFPLVYLEWRDGARVGLVMVGGDHGIVVGGKRRVYRPREDDQLLPLGEAEITAVTDSLTLLTLLPASEDTLTAGDLVELRLECPRPERESLFWRLGLRTVSLNDLNGETIFDYRAVLNMSEVQPDSVLLRALARPIATLADALTAEAYPNLFEPIEGGRFDGRTTRDVMSEASVDDIRACLFHVLTYPARYQGKALEIEELFASWALNGGADSSLELLSLARRMDDEELRALIAPRLDFAVELMIIDEWYAEARRHGREARPEAQAEVLAAMARLCEVVDHPRFWDLYWSAQAGYHESREAWDEAARCWREAAAAAEAGSYSEAVSHNNLGNALGRLERYDEALASYEASLDYYGARRDTLADPDAAESWRGVGQCLVGLGRADEAGPAFEAAIALFERRGGLLETQQICGILSELGDAREALGRYGEAVDAWRRELAVALELGWDDTVASAHADLSDGYWNLGDLRAAVDERLAAVEIYTRLEEDYSVAIANTNLGSILWEMGDAAGSRERYEAALASHESREEWWDVADVLKRMGVNEREKGNHEPALGRLFASLETFAKGDWPADAAAARLEIAEVYEAMGRVALADSVYALALAGYRDIDDIGGEAHVLEWWGYSLIERKAPDQARPRLLRALELSEMTDDLADQADIWRVLANLHTALAGEHDEAIAAAETSLRIAREMPSPKREAQALAMLAGGLFNAGRIDDAFLRLREALAIYTEIGDRAGIAEAQTSLGYYLAARGEYAASREACARAMEVAREAELMGQVAAILSAQAWQHHVAGRDEEAIADAERALAIYEEQDNDWAAAEVYNTLGSAKMSRGFLDEAIRLHERSLAIREAWGDPYGMAAAYNNLGEAYRELGDYDRAVAYFEKALEIGERVRFVNVLTVSAGNLARCYVEMDRPEDALALIDRGLDLAREVGVPPRIADMLAYRGQLLFKLDRLDPAATAFSEALALAREMGRTVAALNLSARLGEIAWRRGDFAASRDSLGAIVPRLREVRNPILYWEPMFYYGRALRDLGERESAVNAMREAIATLESVREQIADEEASGRFQSSHDEVYRDLVDLLMTLGREEEAWEILSLMKTREARELKTGEGPRLNEEDRALVAEAEEIRSHEANLARLLREELNRPEDLRRAELIAAWQSEIDSLKLRFHDFTRMLRSEHNAVYERLEVEPVTFNQLRRGLLPDEAFVEPVILPDRVVTFVVRGGDEPLVFREVPVPEARVLELIRDMRAGLERPDAEWEKARAARLAGLPAPAEEKDPSVPARELHELLIAPLAGDLVGVETLIVSPSGRLRYIPFAALYDGDAYLLERFRITVLTQAGTLTSRRPVDPAAPLLAFGNPDGTLAGAEMEVGELEAIWSGAPVTAVYGENATKERLRREVGHCNILHLATHGVLLNDRPEASYLVLAGEGDASRLTFRDIVLLPLYDVDLAVLSACETAVGDHGEGKEIAGLAYNFEQTGAAAVIASLWMVSDASTSTLMTDLYRALHDEGVSKVEALRRAQLALRRSEKYNHPYYWAPFILIGNWR